MAYILFGKLEDPNIAALYRRGEFDVFVDQEASLQWDLQEDVLYVDGQPLEMTAFFGRADVFGQNSPQRYSNWHLMRNYLIAHPSVRCYNRGYLRETPTKAANLMEAMAVGLKVPWTLIGTGPVEGDCIMKPLTGGAHCVSGNHASYTAIIQERQIGMNRRLFLVGEQSFGFVLDTTRLDYRDDPNVVVGVTDFDEEEISKVRALARKLALTYCAADFVGGVFLEINTGPMFAAFDQVIDGALSAALRSEL